MISPEDAVRAYHAVLERLKIKPQRKLEDDLQLQTAVMSYGGGSSITVPAGVAARGRCGQQETGPTGMPIVVAAARKLPRRKTPPAAATAARRNQQR